MKQPRAEKKYNSGKIAAVTAVATLAAIAVPYLVDGCAVDEPHSALEARKSPLTKKYGGMEPDKSLELTYTYKKDEGIDLGIIAVNSNCDLYSQHTDALEDLRREVAPDDLVYPGRTKIPMLPCADLDPEHLPPRVTLLINTQK